MKRQQHHRQAGISPASWIGFFGFTVLGFAVLLYGAVPALHGPQRADAQGKFAHSAASHVRDAQLSSDSGSPLRVGHRNIEDIRVGDRVFAANPEISDAERATWAEPDWRDWWHLSLEMPLPALDRSDSQTSAASSAGRVEASAGEAEGAAGELRLLHIELLRPDSWVRERLDVVIDEAAERRGALASLQDNELQLGARADLQDSGSALPLAPLSPLRGLYRDLAMTSAVLDASGLEIAALTVELDLPEMGASGTAFVTDIQPCPAIRPKRAEGDGQVVTATFSHPPSTKVLDVTFVDDGYDETGAFSSNSSEDPVSSLGVTDNHLFWSVDRQEFTPIGRMEIGERVLTYHGDTKRIAQKLPRPGPQVVYNLEVYGEHVYFVGEWGLLAHNMYQRELFMQGVDGVWWGRKNGGRMVRIGNAGDSVADVHPNLRRGTLHINAPAAIPGVAEFHLKRR